MTDVRDREREIELEPMDAPIAPRVASRSLVQRALTPLRRVRSQEVAPLPSLDLRGELVVEPQRRTRMIVVLSFILIAVLPPIAAAIYLFAFASDQYVAETRFAVRKSQASKVNDGLDSGSGGSGSGNMSASSIMSGPNLADTDSEIIASYIHSRAAIDDVSRQLDIRAIFERPEADFWARLPHDASPEELTKYWDRMIGVYVETSSGIVQVTASAFRRGDALALVKAILASSEKLANSLSLKMQADQTRLAEDEVRRAEGGVRFALADLTAFRNAQHLIDPVESAQSTGKLLLQLLGDKIETEGKLYVTQKSQGPNAPGISGTRARLDSINKHITELQDQMAGDKAISKNMAATFSRFEELEIKKTFAEKMFDFAREGLERARVNGMRQSIYLAVFVPPTLPQEFTYPQRYMDLFLVALVAFMAWASGAVVTASILDHRL